MFVVVDVGNTRIKWGLCSESGIDSIAILSGSDSTSWEKTFDEWRIAAQTYWLLSGVQPSWIAELRDWLLRRGQRVETLDEPSRLPLEVGLERPDQVGIDRLFDAVAANSQRREGEPAVVIDVGSAVTVDTIDEQGVFLGGAIAPGMRLLAESLHSYTALLPLVPLPTRAPELPGTSTTRAIEVGIYWMTVGGIRSLIDRSASALSKPPSVFLTGGDSERMRSHFPEAHFWSEMTLEGIRLTAESLR